LLFVISLYFVAKVVSVGLKNALYMQVVKIGAQ